MENIQGQLQMNQLDPVLNSEKTGAINEYGDLNRAEESFLR
jgi:hypothetical protein